MNLINDVRDELQSLDQSTKQIQLFSALMLAVFGALGYYAYQHHLDWATSLSAILFLFFLSGFRCSDSVRFVHKYWMGLAFFIGWFVSRILLTLIYFAVVTPIGLISRLFGKQFLDTRFASRRESYWVIRENKKSDYHKMS